MDDNVDFDKIVLTDDEMELFLSFPLNGDSIEVDTEDLRPLLKLKLISRDGTGPRDPDGYLMSHNCFLSTIGKRYRKYLETSKRHHMKTELRAWITLGIALAAFVLSVIAFSWQANTQKEESRQEPPPASTIVEASVLRTTGGFSS